MSKNLLSIINKQDVENLTTLIEKLEGSPFNYLKLENQDLKIVIGENGVTESVEASNNNGKVTELNLAKPESVQVTQQEAAAATVEQPTPEAVLDKPTPVKKGVVTIKATTTGLFYSQPEPGAAPYVKVGDRVEEDTTVGLIEIMKVYSAILSGVAGEIVEIHVEDAQLVEYGQPLFSVKQK
ncbi:hypothetical protein D8M04_12735 [Oceanobacillus piezotolerans]|uniref:Biotin carboxyl carrier protein of acetyl-CoA carboxylase n=1 Tax=Oceanobacillus piezotolerans TaxID=2448030 RepID=A0A498D4G8_9BACI|nr:biotin/lipoyl-containing protein [Oceanobacillus piezotolerans]RLL43775.1 hypothetical protein D8M04_12735 [Oceanobacillus piezotolerans]